MPSRSRPALASAAVASLLILAGCLSATTATTDPSPDPGGDNVEIDGDVGTIGGIVHDDGFSPVPDATVTIPATNQSAKSDQAGTFRIPGVPTGTVQVFAQKPGFQTRAASVGVNSGETTSVSFELEPVPAVEPFSVTKVQRGVLGCGLMVRSYQQVIVGVPICSTANAVVNLSQYEKSRLLWSLSGPIAGWHAGVFELEWTSTQALGSALWELWEVEGCDGDLDARIANASGRSPLWVRLNETQLERFLKKTGEAACSSAATNCNPDGCRMQSRVQPGDDILGSNYPADVGFSFQQTYNIYLSEFYHDAGPPDFSAIPK